MSAAIVSLSDTFVGVKSRLCGVKLWGLIVWCQGVEVDFVSPATHLRMTVFKVEYVRIEA